MRLLFIIFLTGLLMACASDNNNSGGNNPPPNVPDFDGDPDYINPGVDPANPQEKDKGYKIKDDVVYLDGEVLGTISGEGNNLELRDADGNLIATAVPTMGGYKIVIETNNTGGQYKDYYHIVKVDEKWVVDWKNSVIDDGWGITAVPQASADAKRAALKKKIQHLRSSIKSKKLRR